MLLNFQVIKKSFSVYQFNRDSVLPDWIYSSEFYSVTKTRDELSVVAVMNESVPDDIVCSKNWKILKVSGPLDLSLTGILADITNILNQNKIPVFAISTYNTDYILVQEKDLDSSVKALREKGHTISNEM